MSVKEIAGTLSLKPSAVRHHVRILAGSNLVEEVGEKHFRFGRPTSLYRAVQAPVSLEFPKRKYSMLAEIVVEALLQYASIAKAAKTLRDIGYKVGETIINDLAYRHGIHRWDMRLFKQYVIDGHLVELGAQPEMISISDKGLVFRTRNCVFFEVSQKYPEIICNGLNQGIRDGVLERTLGSAEHIRTKCRGHGDPYCEFIFRLKPPETESAKKLVEIVA